MARRETLHLFPDLDDRGDFADAVGKLARLRGRYRIKAEPDGDTRRQRQNRAYFATVVAPFVAYLSEQNYEGDHDKDACHRILAARVLGTVETYDPATGARLTTDPKPTHNLSIEEFSDYMEKCRAYLADMFHIETQDPDPLWRVPETQRYGAAAAAYAKKVTRA